MSQKFTVELERAPLYQATIEVEAADLIEAVAKAYTRVAVDSTLWVISGSKARVLKVTAHANEQAAE